MKKQLFFLLICLSTISFSAFSVTTVRNLRVEYMENPIGIDVQNPRFSWEMESDEIGKKQTAYEITVSDLTGNVVWSSCQISSDSSVGIKYAGASLSPSTGYTWNVTVKDNENTLVSSTENACFETGLMSSGWSNAKWLKMKKEENNQLVNFTLSCDLTVIDQNAGVIFGAKDLNNFHMWAINTYATGHDFPILRRHIFTNNQVQSMDISLEGKFTKADILGVERQFKIQVVNNVIYSYLDNILIDTYESPAMRDGFIGFRVFTGNNQTHERSYVDNVVYTYYQKDNNNVLQPVTFTEDFENGSNDFEGSQTIVVNGNTKMDLKAPGNADYRVLQSVTNGIPMFRSEFSVKKEIQSARVFSSALGVYDLFINGNRVGAKQTDGKVAFDEFKPGWTDYRKTVFYSTYDITDLLKIGQNAVGAQVSSGWLNGNIAHGEYGNPELGFLAKIVVEYTDGSQEIVVSNPETWKASTNSPIRMADIYQGERYDARKESNWKSAGYDDSAWKQTEIHSYFKGEILSFIGQPVRVRPELDQLPKTITIYKGTNPIGSTYGEINIVKTISGNTGFSLKKGETAVIDFGQNIVGWIKFKVKGTRGTSLTGRFAEMLNDSGEESRGNDNAKGTIYLRNLRSAKATMKYTLKGDVNGEIYHPSMTFFGFRYCEISATDDIKIESLIGEVVGNVNEENSSFSTNNPLVNKLYSNVIWGMRGNFLSIPTDCPQRDERLGWMGDTQIFSRAATYNADVASFFHKWAKDVLDSQQPDGSYPSVVPDNWNVGYGRTAWAEAGIIVPWNIYLMYGDKGILESNYNSMERFMNWLATQHFDGFKYNGGNTQYGDWLAYQNTDPRYISVCYYAYAAQLMIKISKALTQSAGDTFDQNAEKYQTLYDNIKAEFQKRYISSRTGLPTIFTQTGYLLALKFGLLATPEKTKQTADELVKMIQANENKLSTGFVGTGILNQTLSQYGASNTAYSLLLQRNDPSWLYSVDQGATTIWERWNSYTIAKGFGDPGMNSFNHYSYGAVSEWMFRYMVGIETDENYPGFKHFILQPNPDLREVADDEKITNVDASYSSYYGKIMSKWERSTNENYRYSVTVPANTTATMYILKLKETAQITQKGIAAELVPGVKSVVDEGTRFVLELESGSYVFEDGLFETSVSKPKADSRILKIYPNPVSKGSSLNIESNLEFISNDTFVQLYSIVGNHIAKYKISQENTLIAMNQTPGAYFLEFRSGDNMMEKMKLIVK